jgi:hypothetical protein
MGPARGPADVPPRALLAAVSHQLAFLAGQSHHPELPGRVDKHQPCSGGIKDADGFVDQGAQEVDDVKVRHEGVGDPDEGGTHTTGAAGHRQLKCYCCRRSRGRVRKL